jgi:hypothetical protein
MMLVLFRFNITASVDPDMVLMSLSYLLNTRCQCLAVESQIAAS